MFETLKNAFKIKDLRNKILFTFAMLVVIRIGSQLPVPGIKVDQFSGWFSQKTGDAFNFFNAFADAPFIRNRQAPGSCGTKGLIVGGEWQILAKHMIELG